MPKDDLYNEVVKTMIDLNEAMKNGDIDDEDVTKAWVKKLEDLNSSFPSTKEFLESRGLENIRQLDNQGYADLTEHLRKTLGNLKSSN